MIAFGEPSIANADPSINSDHFTLLTPFLPALFVLSSDFRVVFPILRSSSTRRIVRKLIQFLFASREQIYTHVPWTRDPSSQRVVSTIF